MIPLTYKVYTVLDWMVGGGGDVESQNMFGRRRCRVNKVKMRIRIANVGGLLRGRGRGADRAPEPPPR